MTKSPSLQIWIDTGYSLFAQDGLNGIQVERMARSLNLNKSGFYHYFGDRDFFLKELIKHHMEIAAVMAEDLRRMEQFDRDFIRILLKYTNPVMVHMQLVRFREHPELSECYAQVNKLVDPALLPSWAEFIGTPNNHEFAGKYFEQARDMFYSRITLDKMNEEYLSGLIQEVRQLVHELIIHK